MKDLISIKRLTKQEINDLLTLADELKEKNKRSEEYKPLRNKTVITSFPPTSLRTRISFETGIFQLGGNAINMQIEFEGKESLEDTIGYLNCWIDYLVIRNSSQELIERIASKSDFSVINSMTKQSHPCEILSDLQSIKEIRKNLRDLKFIFVGEGANICNTWFEIASKLDLSLTQVCPKGYEIDQSLFKYARDNSKGDIKVTNNIQEGFKYADILLTDGWPLDKNSRKEFLPYQINFDTIKIANKNCIVNPCPPFTRGNEISDEIIKSDYFIGYEAKKNLLHMQKAILSSLKK